jgi:sigma-54 dependent transcriptional regulator, acetoin dehydrogenase operon transcriptional activator AcoR
VPEDPRQSPSSRARLERARERFLGGGEIEGVSPDIARSWQRARDVYGVDPRLAQAPLVPPDELAARRARDETLEVAAPILADFAARLAERGHLLAFLDADGCLLSLGGNLRAAARGAGVNFCPGASWREQAAGTNGAGTALAERRPVEVFAAEHYAEAGGAWTSAGAPILAPGAADPVGVVEIRGPWELHDPQAIVAAGAIAAVVEGRLRGIRDARDELVRYALRAARATGDALLAVDGRGRLLAANDAARRRLGLDGELPAEVRERLVQGLRGSAAPQDELALDWPGAGDDRPRVVWSPVTHGERRIGAVVRVLPGLASRAVRAGVRPRAGPTTRYGFQDILGGSARLLAATALAQVAARNDLPVVLHGESGTGKELFAHGIHATSARAARPFVTVNCGAIPAPLVEAELFGYEPGTFTGGQREGRAGKLEEADGGTLFLDEVSELSPQAQTALLRAVQESEIVRVGGFAPRRVDVRLVAATNRDLSAEVGAGRFRQDLFFRLNVLAIEIPPLRERIEDVPLLASAFLAEAETKIGRPGLELSEDAVDALTRHAWPGNVRELRNVILRAAAVAPTPRIDAGDLTLVRLRAPAAPPPADPASAPYAPPGEEGAEPERDELVAALDRCGWNIARTATSLGVSRMTLYRRLRRFGITR